MATGLYVHIPFCEKKCGYCDFLSFPTDALTRKTYVKKLCEEIREMAVAYKEKHSQKPVLNSVYIGGGTPSLLSVPEIAEIMFMINSSFAFKNAEITIEVNPGTVDYEKLQAYYHNGINRLSFGLQSTKDSELSILGRIHTFEDFLEAYDKARDVGFTNINVDLMTAIPGQSVSVVAQSLQVICELEPEHISLYSLIIEENTPFYELYNQKNGTNKHLIPSEEVEMQMDSTILKVMEAYQYYRYEISNYSREGYECRHNQLYWRMGEYLGVGLGASSLWEGRRFHNTRDLKDYLHYHFDKNEEPSIRIYDDSEDEKERFLSRMEEFCFLGLRQTKGLSKMEFEFLFHKSIKEVFHEAIDSLIKENLLEEEGDRLYFNHYGMAISNQLLVRFLIDREND